MNPAYSDLPKITLRKTRDVDVVVNTITDPGHFYVTLSGKEFTWNDSKNQIEMWKIFPHKIHLSGVRGATCYRPQRSWGKVMFLHVSVILFTGGAEADTPLGADPPPPRSRPTPSQEQTHPLPGADPQDQASPQAQCILGDTGNKQAVCILLEYNFVFGLLFQRKDQLVFFLFPEQVNRLSELECDVKDHCSKQEPDPDLELKAGDICCALSQDPGTVQLCTCDIASKWFSALLLYHSEHEEGHI